MLQLNHNVKKIIVYDYNQHNIIQSFIKKHNTDTVLILINQHFASVLLILLIIPQITFQDIWLLRDPLKFDVKYQASAQPFLILGMLVTATAVGHSYLING